jgi:hypothetical protein
MIVIQTLHGINHSNLEDTPEEHLELAATAFDRLVEKAMQRIASDSVR